MKTITVSVRGKKVGELKGELFSKKVLRSKHFFWKYSAWGFDRGMMEALKSRGCKNIRITEKKSGDVFNISMDCAFMYSIEEDQGHGVQLFVPEKRFKIKDDKVKLS